MLERPVGRPLFSPEDIGLALKPDITALHLSIELKLQLRAEL
jgi:hypothetical protein